MPSKSFRDLSRRERLFRFRKLAHLALHEYGLAEAKLTLLQYGENVIYRVDPPNGSQALSKNSPYHPNRFLLRLHAWDEKAYIHSEMIWLDALVKQARLCAPAPVRMLNGDFVVKVSSVDLPNGRCVTLLRWLNGRKLNQGFRSKHMILVGKLMARLHNFSSAWQPPEEFSRPAWDWDAQLGGSHFHVSREILIDSMPKEFQQPFLIVSQQAKSVMENLGNKADAFGLIHADLYPENILFKAGQAYPIDFEDCGFGNWIWDIAVALCTWAWDENWDRFRDEFFDGYSAIRTLPNEQWKLLDLFIATQYATMLLWSSAFLIQDPQRADEYIPWRDDSGNRLLKYFDLA